MGALLNRRRYMGGGSSLPYDAELEYMNIHAYNYFLTDYYPNQDTEIECVCNMPDALSFLVCGAKGSGQNPNAQIEFYSWGNTIEYHYKTTNWRPGVIWRNYTGKYVTATLRGMGNYSSIVDSDGVILNEQLIPDLGNFSIEYPLAVFGLNRNGTIAYYDKNDGRVKSFKIKENGLLLHDYIPVRVGTIGYFYDRLSNRMFESKGGGSFVPGPDKIGGVNA